MKQKQKSLFDEEDRMKLLSKLGDPLETLNKVIKWEKFRSALTRVCRKEDTEKGVRPPYDVIVMFKVIVLQSLYNLSDDQVEYQINDRISFMRFLGVGLTRFRTQKLCGNLKTISRSGSDERTVLSV